MSVEAFSSLPLQAGSAVAAAAGRGALWAISAYMRAPLRNTAVAALVGFSALAGTNALYNQSGHHPAPLFGSFDGRALSMGAEPEPVIPAERPAKLFQQAATPVETTGSITTPATAPAEAIGNADVFEIQRKLSAFALYDGKVDGLYGPRTARSIRAFEEKLGRAPTGQLTPEIVELIKATPIIAEPAPVAAAPAPAAAAEPALTLEAPAPLVASASAEQAGGTGISTLEMTTPPAAEANAPTKRVVETIAVRAELPAAEVVTTPIDVVKAATDPKVVSAVQRGLSSLGFLHGTIDGVAGEATAKAIRNFEVYYNYNVTGRITPELINLLAQNGAVL